MARNDNFFNRLTRLFRSGPAIQRKVKGYNYNNYFDNDIIRGNYGYRAPFPFGRESSPFSVLGAYGLLDRMSRYAEFCFSADTCVYTLDGVYTIKELAEKYPNGENIKVYSYDHSKNEIVVATAHHPRITKDGKVQKLVQITFEDGGKVKTTLDHKFLLRAGEYVEAKDLIVGQALMPFYVKDITASGYKHIYTINKKEHNPYGWTAEHILVAEHFLGRKLNPQEVVHHVDFNPSNNLPSNLKVMTEAEHRHYHSLLNNNNKKGKSNKKHSVWMRNNNPVKRQEITALKIFETASAVDFSLAKTKRLLKADVNLLKRRLREIGYENWLDFKADKDKLTTIRNAAQIYEEMQSPEIEDIIKTSEEHECQSIYRLASILKCTENSIRRRLSAHGYGSWSEFMEKSPKRTRDSYSTDNSVSYQQICDIYDPVMSAEMLAEQLNTSINKIKTCIERQGFNSFGDWKLSYTNHKIASIEFLQEEEVVYNITVDEHHNLAVGSKLLNPITNDSGSTTRTHSMVICRQSEMEYTPEIAAALNIYADECTTGDERGKTFHILSSNPQIKKSLDELFYDILNIEFNLRPWVRNLVKYGDLFLYNEVIPDIGVVNVQPIRVNELEREEGWDPNDPYAVRFKWLTRGNRYLENWQVTHMRILGNDMFLPYGTSVLEPARRIWRQLCHAKGTRVWTKSGWENIEDIKPGQEVFSYDFDHNITIPTKVKAVYPMGKQEILKIKTNHRTINVTPNHGLLVKEENGNIGYKMAKNLVIDKDQLVLPRLPEDRNGFYTNSKKSNRTKHFISLNKKRIPGWIFRSSIEQRLMYLQKISEFYHSEKDNEIILTNLKLIKDIKTLAEMSGVVVSSDIEKIYKTHKKSLFKININLNSQISQNVYEKVISTTKWKNQEQTYDLQVENPLHNFIAEGIVTHNTMMEDSMLVYRVVRSPERRVFYIDVGNIAPNDIPSYMEQAKQTLRARDVVSRQDGRVDQRYNPLPVHKDTPIPLLDGRTISIEDLSKEYDTGKENWVYSMQDQTQQIVPGKVIWCGKNYTAQKLIKVWLDDDTYITTAPEHPFVLRDGSSKRADELTIGQSLMPFYRDENSLGYERCYNPATQKYETTHSLVAKNIFSEKWIKTNQPVVHHKKPWQGQSNKKNNHPSNLEIMNFWEHRKWHRDFIQHTLLREDVLKENSKRICEFNKTLEHSINVSQTNRKYNKGKKLAQAYNGTELHKQHNELRTRAQKESWEKNSLSRRKAMRWNIPELFWAELSRIVKENPTLGREKIHNLLMQNESIVQALKANQNTERSVEKFSFAAWEGELVRKGFAKLAGYREHILNEQNIGYKNHKIKNIEVLEVSGEDVYCMTVVGPEGEDDRHNFAAQTICNDNKASNNGVFVLNSVDDDYFIPVRGGQTGTKIETLAGGQNATATEDVEYLQKKLFAAIQVPKPYLNFTEGMSAKASLAQQDVRFSRTIIALQKIAIAELNKLAMIHLYSKGFNEEDLLDFHLKLANPSTIALLQKLENLASKFDIAAKAKETKLVDELWIQKNIIELSDDELMNIEQGRREDKIREVELESIAVSANPDPGPARMVSPFDNSNYEIPGEDVSRVKPSKEDDFFQKMDDYSQIQNYKKEQEEETFARPDVDGTSPPVQAIPFVKRTEKNRLRRVGAGGKSNLEMPDFGAMFDRKNVSLTDIYDKKFLDNPLIERVLEEELNLNANNFIPRDFVSTLDKLKIFLEQNRVKTKMVLEENEQIEIKMNNDELLIESVDRGNESSDENEKVDISEIDLSRID